MTPKDVAEQIGKTLANERGGCLKFVCIWRLKGDPLDDGCSHIRRCSVGEFLSEESNQQGVWLIDGGWGFPPGAIAVQWQGDRWKNLGYASPANEQWMQLVGEVESPHGD